jgi:hypothetical protein
VTSDIRVSGESCDSCEKPQNKVKCWNFERNTRGETFTSVRERSMCDASIKVMTSRGMQRRPMPQLAQRETWIRSPASRPHANTMNLCFPIIPNRTGITEIKRLPRMSPLGQWETILLIKLLISHLTRSLKRETNGIMGLIIISHQSGRRRKGMCCRLGFLKFESEV